MKTMVRINNYSYNDRELSQIIRRKMITKSERNRKKFNKENDRKHYRVEF